jgi:hypothetical protein
MRHGSILSGKQGGEAARREMRAAGICVGEEGDQSALTAKGGLMVQTDFVRFGSVQIARVAVQAPQHGEDHGLKLSDIDL